MGQQESVEPLEGTGVVTSRDATSGEVWACPLCKQYGPCEKTECFLKLKIAPSAVASTSRDTFLRDLGNRPQDAWTASEISQLFLYALGCNNLRSAPSTAGGSDDLLQAVRGWVDARATKDWEGVLHAEWNLNEAFRRAVGLPSAPMHVPSSTAMPSLQEAANLLRDAQPLAKQNTQEWLAWCLSVRGWLCAYDTGIAPSAIGLDEETIKRAEDTLIVVADPKADGACSFWRARARFLAEQILRSSSTVATNTNTPESVKRG